MSIQEKCKLLTKGVYKDIPNELTLKRIPTVSELDYVNDDEFDRVLIEKILPEAVEEKINFSDLLEIDFQWVCRSLRILNYGPYHTTNTIWCDQCGTTSHGEYRVKITSIGCKELPDKFTNDFTISRDQFIDFNGDIKFRLPTIQKILNAYKDKAFQTADGRLNRELARICYMVYSIKGKEAMTPVEVRLQLEKELSAADYLILKGMVSDMADFGLRAGGPTECPKCKSPEAAFIGLTSDRFFRPTLGDMRAWKADRVSAETETPGGEDK